MKNIKFFIIGIFLFSVNSFAWGGKGHAIVAEVAFNYLDANTKKIVLQYLDTMTIEEASKWMDKIKKDHSYNYMEPYHYVNFEKGEKVKNKGGNNIISILTSTINELKNYKKLPKEEVKKKICILIHLVGDLHQPLHVGYGYDKGGNKVQLNFNGKGTNLHSLFDSEIIKYKKITLRDCLNTNLLNQNQIPSFQKKDIVDWANQSRNNLDGIYNFNGHKVTEEYVNRNAILIQKQLFIAGVRLASVLKTVFKK